MKPEFEACLAVLEQSECGIIASFHLGRAPTSTVLIKHPYEAFNATMKTEICRVDYTAKLKVTILPHISRGMIDYLVNNNYITEEQGRR